MPDDVLFHKKHNLNHPLAIYNKSLQRILDAFLAVLNKLKDRKNILTVKIDKLKKSPVKSKTDPLAEENLQDLLNAQKELLDSLMAHIDDCYHILGSRVRAN